MATNGMVANPTKTTFMVLNHKTIEALKIKVGEAIITQVSSFSVLGQKKGLYFFVFLFANPRLNNMKNG